MNPHIYTAAIIGTGRIGFSLGLDKKREQPASHTMALLSNRRIRLVAGCDVDSQRLELPLVLVRKKGKLPGKRYSCKYSLEYGMAEIEAHIDDIKKGQRVVVIDDLIATGGTLQAARTIFEQGGAQVVEFFGVVGLPFLKYQEVLNPTPVRTIINYDSE